MLKKLFIFLFFLSFFNSSVFADKLQEIQNREYIKAGVKYDFKPFGFIDKHGKIAGFEIDLLRFIADKLNVGVKFYQVTSQNRIPMLVKGKVDIIVASMTHKVQRDQKIDYSVSYFFDGQAILAKRNAKEKSYKDYRNKKVGAIKGATSGSNFERIQPKAKVVYFGEYPQALRALRSGNIDAVTTDLAWCTTQVKDSDGYYKVVGNTLSFEPYGMGVPENESNFRDMINFQIQQLVREGTYQELYEKWFGVKPKRLPEVWPL